ncbi:T9SS type A sorting domain-containing protein [Nonlabens ulvanivorans]|uniref:T9SS type A sorting domain-containing protein n=1 Tax=Nonlabens ulvanivorans TaxID=906888 RepID=UPI003D65158E
MHYFFEKLDSGQAQLFSLDGKEIWNGNVENGQIEFNDLHAGLYILKVNNNDQTISMKLLKK